LRKRWDDGRMEMAVAWGDCFLKKDKEFSVFRAAPSWRMAATEQYAEEGCRGESVMLK
jgi:hypothetical protein